MTNKIVNKQMTLKEKVFPYWRTKFISYFDIDNNTIKVDISTLNARESVFVDNVLVSKKRNWGQNSIHSFSIDNKNYDIVVDIKSSFKGPIDVSLKSDGHVIDGDHWVFPSVLPGLVVGFLFALIGFSCSAIVFNAFL